MSMFGRRRMSHVTPFLVVAIAAIAQTSLAATNQIQRLAGELQICTTPDPRQPSSAFDVAQSPSDADGDYWIAYRCNVPCANWQDCQVPLGGDATKQSVAFVVDGMGGHLAFTTRQNGNKTVLLHTGGGGASYMTNLSRRIEDTSDAKVVMVRWAWGFLAGVGSRARRRPQLACRT